ncbi:MAG TPA: hypothetical protein VMW47_02050 [Verrucomicrobiae bacterium]|nr:hypothetical protein [Verrucomicrobiae bacterium]
MATSTGHVYPYGNAVFYGSPYASGLRLANVVALAAAPGGAGYWVLTAQGRVLAYGSVVAAGSITTAQLRDTTAVAMTATPDGRGYWVLTARGSVWPFGDAPRLGGVPIVTHSTDHAVGISVDPTGRGYWIATRNGHVFAFGDAPQLGSPSTDGLPRTTTLAILDGSAGYGYWALTATWGFAVTSYGQAPTFGRYWCDSRPLVGAPVAFSGNVYAYGLWIATTTGHVFTCSMNPGELSTIAFHGSPYASGIRNQRTVAIAAVPGPGDSAEVVQPCVAADLALSAGPVAPVQAGTPTDVSLVNTSGVPCSIQGALTADATLADGSREAIPVESAFDTTDVTILGSARNPEMGVAEFWVLVRVTVRGDTTGCPLSTGFALTISSVGTALILPDYQVPVCGAAADLSIQFDAENVSEL